MTRKDLQEDIFAILTLENLPPERKDQMLDQMIELVLTRVWLRVKPALENLPGLDDAQTKDPDVVLAWLEQHVPNYMDLLHEETQKLKEELAGLK